MTTVETKHWSTALSDLGACPEAIEWAEGQPNLASAWQHCGRPDWMLWLLDRTNASKMSIVRIAVDCAKSVLPLADGIPEAGEAIAAAERWIDDPSEVNGTAALVFASAAFVSARAADRAARAAFHASYAAGNAAASAASYAAAHAACAVAHATLAAACAAAHAAAHASYAAANAAANAAADAACCAIIRKHFPSPPKL